MLWLQNSCETAVVSLACQLTPSALHMKEPACVGGQEKERKNEGCGGRAGTAVYLSPPCRNLYRTLRALIKDQTMVCSTTLTHTHRQNKNPGTHISGTYVIKPNRALMFCLKLKRVASEMKDMERGCISGCTHLKIL